MSFKVGKTVAGVKYNGTKIAGMGTFSLSGFSRETLEDTEFGDDVKTYLFGMGDGGTVSFSGLYDPDDTTGQVAFDALCAAGTSIGTGTSGLAFYIDASSYWSLSGSGATMLPTKSHSVSLDKNGLGQITFEAKISGGQMVLS